uniref:ACT domain-containing protein n=1 Tax=Tetradesmus obliquus TaxID=3088 RepID=A0A383VZI1_TETOB|eukprot:jgi/Sobl393_1/13059/SZX69806.1
MALAAKCSSKLCSSLKPCRNSGKPCVHRAPVSISRSSVHYGQRNGVRLQAANNGATATADKSATAPVPIVKIDNMSDPFATKVTVEFGDKLGELLDTVTALKNLNLNIRKAALVSPGKASTFFITDADTSEKVLKSARLEEIRMTIINNMLYYHPESSETLVAGKSFQPPSRDQTHPLGPKARAVVQTTIEVKEAPNGSCSLLAVTTRDRPGLLVDIVSVLKDINVNVVSAEIDTMGDEAKDEFFVTYHGEPLNPPMVQLVTNSLQYYLSLAEVEKEESY